MTYEPGQQVLVRVKLLRLFIDDTAEIEITDDKERYPRLNVLTADIVGPAPATPDAEATIADLRVGWDAAEREIARLKDQIRALSMEAAGPDGGGGQ